MAKPALWDCAFSGQAIDDDATKAKFDKLWHDFLAAVSLLDGNEGFEDGNCNGTWYSYKNGESPEVTNYHERNHHKSSGKK